MEGRKSNKGLVICLIILLLAFACISVLLGMGIVKSPFVKEEKCKETATVVTNDDTKKESNTDSVVYTFDGISGTYTASVENTLEETSDKTSITLALYDNGTFSYTSSFVSVTGFIGNYIIKDNKIILNKLYARGSDVGKSRTSGTVTFTLNENGSLSAMLKVEPNESEKEITLSKTEDNSSENKFDAVMLFPERE